MSKTSQSHNLPANKPESLTKSARLFRYYILLILPIALLSAMLFSALSHQYLVDNLIKNEEKNNIYLANILSNSIRSHFKSLITTTDGLSDTRTQEHKQTQDLNRLIHNITAGLNIAALKIYTLNGYAIYTSYLEPAEKTETNNFSFKQSTQGKTTSRISFSGSSGATSQLFTDKDILSTYIPINIKYKNNIGTVFVIHKDVTKSVNEINNMKIKIFSVFFIILSFVIAVILLLEKITATKNKIYDTAQSKDIETIHNLAFYDNLTGLPNRVLFSDRLNHSLLLASRNQKLVVLMFLDLDKFKQINDNLGHEAGDQLLVQVSERLVDCVRSGDTVSRLSGDEFTLIIESLSTIEPATFIARKIIDNLARPFEINKNNVYVTCSIGLSVYPFNDDNAESLVKKADSAMFYSKSTGRNNFHYFEPDMLQHGSQRFELENDLNTALNDSQFSLYYQPKIELANLTISGAEVLLHWNHPQKGIIPPDDFIPLLEETGIIADVTEWALEKSCQQAKRWIDEGRKPVTLSVNISSIHFYQADFAEIISSILDKTKLPAEYLELELSESCLMENIDTVKDIMQSLKDIGIKLTIDKFGTGYSSLNYVCKLPIDTLKIDKSFMHNMMNDSDKRATVTAIISFAHGLRLNVVVEGIQSMEQLTFVKAMRCTAAQGTFLSKPLPAEDFNTLYKEASSFQRTLRQAHHG